MLTSKRFLRHFLAPLILAGIAALLLARGARADSAPSGRGASAPDWDALLATPSAQGIRFGVKLGDGYGHAADEPFVPASLTKLFTAGLALERLGADHVFTTEITYLRLDEQAPGRVGELVIHGAGDPTWGALGEAPGARFAALARRLSQAGVREVLGPIRLVAADGRWAPVQDPPRGWGEDDLVTCDGALPQAFNVALDCGTLIIENIGGWYPRWKEELLTAPVSLDVTESAEGAATRLRVERDGGGFRITGTIAPSESHIELRLPVYDAAAWALGLLERALALQGIGRPQTGRAAAAAGAPVAVSFRLASPPLREILKPFLKESINLIGQDLLLQAGGAVALADYAASRAGAGQRFYDGSGMSRENQVTARGVLGLLRSLAGSPDFALLWDSLPVAGVDGTLARRMRATAAQGVVRAKTGTLSGVYNLAGYVPSYNALGMISGYTPFVVLAAAETGMSAPPAAAARAAEDSLAARLVEWINH